MTVRVEHGDCLAVIPRLVAEGVVCDAVVTDPPYHLTTTLARFGKIDINANDATSTRLRKKLNGAARLAHGFMNQQWDGGDISFRPETWATVATILRPGAFLVAFGGTRTYHRLVCAIEDGGFVIQDQIAWMFATGFPKRRDMLKPAFEPIVLAYKPGGKRTMQVDECRIEGGGNKTFDRFAGDRPRDQYRTGTTGTAVATDLGRWPANIVTDGSDEVLACLPESSSTHPGNIKPTPSTEHTYGKYGTRSLIGHIDSGSVARFFFSAKAGVQDRWGSRHPTVKPVDLIAWLVKLVCPPGGLFLDPFAGSGTAAVAALKVGRNAILIEQAAGYIADIRERIAFYEGGGTHSVQAKNRSRKRDEGPLFANPEAME